MQTFTHLHVHTEYSLLDGSAKIDELLERAEELGMAHLAVTDHGAMHGVIDFYKAAVRRKIKPIMGCEVYITADRHNKSGGHSASNHLVLLAENNLGYRNLMKLSSCGFTEGFYYKPRIDFALLREYSDGLIALSACLAGEVPRAIANLGYERAKEIALRYDKLFGRGNFYLELQNHGLPEQKHVLPALVRISEETGIPLVATNDVHYILEEDADSHDILLCIQTNTTVNDPTRMRYEGGQFYLKSQAQMHELFAHLPQALENTVKIAERCNVEIEFNSYKLPKFRLPAGDAAHGVPGTPPVGDAAHGVPGSPPAGDAAHGVPGSPPVGDAAHGVPGAPPVSADHGTPGGASPTQDAPAYLAALCKKGLAERYGEESARHLLRLEYELQTIAQMGFADYFLIVWDFIRYARGKGIIVGPGRGSAAGSLVAYSLGITGVDPIKYGLIFERFLNPERISMPDIDIDFCYVRRQEVIDYVVAKYGTEKVAQIITFGTMAARAATRDVGRALAFSYGDADRIAKMLPFGASIKSALKINPELKKAYESEQTTKILLDMSMRLEGLVRHASTHAAGVVICDRPLYEYVPLYYSDGSVSTQFSMNVLEELGLLKMDFLGLRTLTVIQQAILEIERGTGIKVDFDKMDYGDSAVYELISRADTDGVFQLESSGMKSFMRELKPRCFEDIIAGIALFRPGPMDFIPKYIQGKNKAGAITYTHPLLEPILRETYGCIVYQEQVMEIVRKLAGYSLAGSDLLRRAMSKKKGDIMARERRNFIDGCAENGIPPETAARIFGEMSDFAKYAFNKSHAAAYAVIGYRTAWLKHYYPVEFMAATLSTTADTAEYIYSCKKMGIALLPPDVNEGFAHFSVAGGQNRGSIRFGLSSIKNVGGAAAREIVAERRNGAYTSFADFISRQKSLNKRTLESLIKAGALDSLEPFDSIRAGQSRARYMAIYPNLLNAKSDKLDGQLDLFGSGFAEEPAADLPDVPEYTQAAILNDEKELLGVYVSGHPLAPFEELFERHFTVTSRTLAKMPDRQKVTWGGMIGKKSVKYTRSGGKPFAFVTVEDLYGQAEVIVFPQIYEKCGHRLEEGKVILLQGHVSVREDEDAKIIADRISMYRG